MSDPVPALIWCPFPDRECASGVAGTLLDEGLIGTRLAEVGNRRTVWMQIIADVLQRPVQRLNGHPGSCLGAAWTAAMGIKAANDWSAISRFVSPADRLEPNPANARVYREAYAAFRELYPVVADFQRKVTS